MKVIKEGNRHILQPWVATCICWNCGSLLNIDGTDLTHYESDDGRNGMDSHIIFSCGSCNNSNEVTGKRIQGHMLRHLTTIRGYPEGTYKSCENLHVLEAGEYD